MKYSILSLLFILSTTALLRAQMLPFIYHHQANTFLANPAIPVVHRIINPGTGEFNYRHAASMTYRDQWWQFGELRPRTYTASYHHYLKPVDRGVDFWVGGYFFRDQIGTSSETGGYTSFSGHKDLGYDQHLYAGMTLGIKQFSVRNQNLRTGVADPFLGANDKTEYLIDPGIGVFYTNQAFFAGFSIPQIVGITANGTRERLHHYYVLFGTSLQKRIGPFRSIEPYIWLRTIRNTASQMDMNVKAELYTRIPMWVILGIDNTVAIHFDYGLILPINQGIQDLRVSFGYDNRITLASQLGGAFEMSVAWLVK